jgi:nitronate monooxygenase
MNHALESLGVALPIIQGPFGGGLSTPKLVAEVSNHGGMGSFGLYHLSPDEITATVQQIRSLTSNAFNLNLWVSTHDRDIATISDEEFERLWQIFAPYFAELNVPKPKRPQKIHQNFDDQVEAVLDARPAMFSFIFGVPKRSILEECKRRGIVTSGVATTLAEAEALDQANVDIIVASGFEAGGHRASFLAGAEESLTGTFVLTQLISRHVKAPVISAGGIADGKGVRAAMMLGAKAAQIGTGFLACEESGASPEHKEALFDRRARQTTLTRTFSGRLARGLKNRWIDELTPRTDLPAFPIQGWFAAQLKAAALKANKSELTAMWSGQIAPTLKHKKAASLLEAIAADL